MSLKILFTNNTLDFRSGTELYVRDVALSLLARGHRVAAYSSRLGSVAEDLSRAGVAVTDDLEGVPFLPDVIHGQHHLDAMRALLHFPLQPAVYFCHGIVPWEETPPRFPRIRQYVAVDDWSAQNVVQSVGIARDRVVVLPNFVDLERFASRPPLPVKPRRALVFSSTLSSDGIQVIREACRRSGLTLDLLGMVSGRYCADPENVIGRYDVVLAKGRAALEAMAVGAAVVACDYGLLGPMVKSVNLDALRRLNLGLASLTRPLEVEGLVEALSHYDARDAAAVSQRIRREAGRETVVDQVLALYRKAIEEQRGAAPDPGAESQAVGRYLDLVGSKARERLELPDDVCREYQRLREEFDALNRTLTIRLRNRMLSFPGLGRAIRRWIAQRGSQGPV